MVLTPRRVALAAAEALAEGLLGLPMEEDELAEVLVGAWCQRRKYPLLLFFNCRIPVFLVVEDIVDCRAVSLSSVRSRVRVVVVVARQRSQKFEMVKFIRPTTKRRYPGLGTCLRHQHAIKPFSVAATIGTNKLSSHTQQGLMPTFGQDGRHMLMYAYGTHCHHLLGHFRPRARLRAT